MIFIIKFYVKLNLIKEITQKNSYDHLIHSVCRWQEATRIT